MSEGRLWLGYLFLLGMVFRGGDLGGDWEVCDIDEVVEIEIVIFLVYNCFV